MTRTSQTIAQQFETCFSDIYETRMHDVPIVNRKLHVKAMGFQVWQDQILGVLLTPWFLNLILVPNEFTQNDSSPKVSEKKMVAFTSGSFEFIYNHEPSVGGFWSCSLLSPVLDLESQELAEQTAIEALNLILSDESLNAQGDIQTSELVAKWNEPAPALDEHHDVQINETDPSDRVEPVSQGGSVSAVDEHDALTGWAEKKLVATSKQDKELAQPSKRALFRQLTQSKEQ